MVFNLKNIKTVKIVQTIFKVLVFYWLMCYFSYKYFRDEKK